MMGECGGQARRGIKCEGDSFRLLRLRAAVVGRDNQKHVSWNEERRW